MEIAIEREREEHNDLMKQKEKEYEETEQQLTANNQDLRTYGLAALVACSLHCFVVSSHRLLAALFHHFFAACECNCSHNHSTIIVHRMTRDETFSVSFILYYFLRF